MRVEVSRPREQRITGFGGGFSREKRSFGFKRRNFDRGAADGGDAGNTQEPEGEGRFKPRKKFGWRPHEKRGFGGEGKPFNRKKGGFKKRFYDGDSERQNRRIAARAITAESPTSKNKNLPRFFVSKRI